ncbi:MAG: immunity 26/phosphotriesterase HocA family protein [Muribaculaceae bacterium]|nr:immunity 26/phosphotriesterase HocA family protein [Muribaculaceae bacterium]
MAKRIITKIGDVFCVDFRDGTKGYFQYVAKDMTQLNSSVIRVFNTHYPIDQELSIEDIVNGDVAFYAHTVLRAGIEEGLWFKVGKSVNVGADLLNRVIFVQKRYCADLVPHYSGWWWNWHINEEMKYSPQILLMFKKNVESGSVISCFLIVFRMFSGYYPHTNSFFDLKPRVPRDGYKSYIEYLHKGTMYYLYYSGNQLEECLTVKDGKIRKLDRDEAIRDNKKFANFSGINWECINFITRKDFEDIKNNIKPFIYEINLYEPQYRDYSGLHSCWDDIWDILGVANN